MREYLRPAVRAVPRAVAERLGRCDITVMTQLPGDAASTWRFRVGGLDVLLASESVDPHELGMELLLCLGQALWETAGGAEREAWLKLLRREILAGFPGDIDEDTLREKRLLLAGPASARSRRRLLRYAGAAYAGSVAQYIHAMWHDVTALTGPEHLPPEFLRLRLETLARWFAPNRGYQVFGKTPKQS